MSIYDSRLILVYFCVVAAVLGAALGSFLNCAAWRIAHGESFLRGRSHCPACGHSLSALDLIPVLSWLFLKGRCRYCQEKISPRYVLSELLFALVSVLCLLRFDLTVLCLRNYIFFCCLFCLSLVDLESYVIPNGCLLIPAGVWLMTLPFLRPGWKVIVLHILAGLVFGGGLLLLSLAMDRILKKESLGGGDVKLFALVGLYLGFVSSLFSLLLAAVLGLAFVFLLREKRSRNGGQIPFGPSIAAAAGLVLMYGDPIVQWYLGLL